MLAKATSPTREPTTNAATLGDLIDRTIQKRPTPTIGEANISKDKIHRYPSRPDNPRRMEPRPMTPKTHAVPRRPEVSQFLGDENRTRVPSRLTATNPSRPRLLSAYSKFPTWAR